MGGRPDIALCGGASFGLFTGNHPKTFGALAMSTETHDEDVVAYVVLHQATSSPKKVAEEFNLTVERAMELWDQATCTR